MSSITENPIEFTAELAANTLDTTSQPFWDSIFDRLQQ